MSERGVGVQRRWVLSLCWAAVLLDGFDLVVLGSVLPELLDRGQWGLTHASASLASTAGLVGMTIGALVIGTTLGCQVLREQVRIDPEAEAAGMWLATPRSDRYLRVMPAMVGTANLDWVLRTVGARIEELETLLGNSRPGAGGVSALSFLASSGERAPFVEPHARGQFTGLSLETTPADLVRAMCEAVAYAARHNLETAGLTGDVSACGG